MRVETATLATGDYLLKGLEHPAASGIVIERKGSLSDLLSVVGRDRDRFDREVERMLAFRAAFLVIEADWWQVESGEYRSQVKPTTVIGSLLGWQERGLQVCFLGDRQRSQTYVSRLLFHCARRR